MKSLSIAVVGITYPNKANGPTRLFELALCLPGEPVELRPEPKNEHDEHAIGVWSIRGVQLGYLPSERAVLISSYLRRGVEVRAIFQAMGEMVAYCRVAFDEDPVLPPVVNRSRAGDDSFYPDDPGGGWDA